MKLLEEIGERRGVQLAQDLRAVMSTPEGRRVMAWVVYDLGLYESSAGSGHLFAGHVRDGVSSYGHQCYYAGKHDTGVDVANLLKRVCHDRWCEMRREWDDLERHVMNLLEGEEER